MPSTGVINRSDVIRLYCKSSLTRSINRIYPELTTLALTIDKD